ncbi:DNA-directed DNA/RNA polymerase mu [Hippocampus zosterae]|uniref:DNA-directed DNA/RNA polymerase mu n=1 Tax=Hippocampus zosterae TaxID=109293 RepID=UPI00223E10E1|nr:DNA-directed DNA/RNA polymerase mu [Hippocampus zosterae]
MVPLKRRKVSSSTGGASTSDSWDDASKFPQVVLFLLERKMGTSRRHFLTELGRKKGFRVDESFTENVTHVISEKNSGDEVKSWLSSQGHDQTAAHLVDISWLTESLSAGCPLDILQQHRLMERPASSGDETATFSMPIYACQRRTTMDHRNAVFTEALSLLAENAELSQDEGRAVAFRRAAATLKAFPESLTDARQLRGCPCLGQHSLSVIQDILENGSSREVEATRQSQRFKAMKLLTGIFGVGAKTAAQWFQEGIRNLPQLRQSGRVLTRAQQAGLAHYDDLTQPVTRAEADTIGQIVEEAVGAKLPSARVTLVGGFRRGKPSGHDVDFLITHPEEGREEGLIPKVVAHLENRDFLLYHKSNRNSYTEASGTPASTMDHFERCFSIFKLPMPEGGEPHSRQDDAALRRGECRRWRAVRVDLVVCPFSQFAFALLGWTGSKLFERELRRWATQQKNMSLSSHALYDNKQREYLKAETEEEIFAHLSLDYIPPSQRNA